MNQLYQRAWRSVISPMKFTHHIGSLCPKQQSIGGKVLQRIDFSFKNDEDKSISAIILKQLNAQPDNMILYLHGNGGSKLQSLGFTSLICKNNIGVIAFDFVGCGNSDNGFLTYGLNQSKDAFSVVNQAKKYVTIKKLSVWGRSMGAATAIILAQKKYFPIQSLVLDSPFHNLLYVIQKVMRTETEMPKGICYIASYWLSQQINKKLNLQVFGIDYLQIYKKSGKLIPTLFFYSQTDQIVSKQQVFNFYKSCRTHKHLFQIFQKHEQQRSISVFDEGVQWIKSIPLKKTNKIKLSYYCDLVQIENSQIKSGRGICCCTNLN